MVQRLCGICPVSHHLAASQGARPRGRRASGHAQSADKIRRLMHYGQVMQSQRAALLPPVVARPAVRLRLRGRPAQHRRRRRGPSRARAQGRAAAQVRPGGDPRHRRQAHPRHRLDARRHEPARQRRPTATLLRREVAPDARLGAAGGRHRRADCTRRTRRCTTASAAFRSNLLSLVRADGAMELYDGVLRVRDADGAILIDGASDQSYLELIEEEVQALDLHEVPATCAASAASTAGTASARWRGCRTATSSRRPLAEAQRREFVAEAGGRRSTPRWPTTGRG